MLFLLHTMIEHDYYVEKSANDAKTASVDSSPSWMLADAHAQRYSIPDGTLYQNQADLYRRLSWVQIAVRAVASVVATCGFNVYRQRRSVVGAESRVALPYHDFEILLNRPNPLDSRYELLESTASYRLVAGNAYWWLNRESPDAKPTEIWPIPPYQIMPVPDGSNYLKGYAFSPHGYLGTTWLTAPPIPLELHEVVHFKSFNPNSRFVGLSMIEALSTIASADLKAQEYNANFFGEDNAKAPGALVFTDMVNDMDWERIQGDFKAHYGGNKRKMMMLRGAGQGGVSWLQMGLTQQEMQFLDSRTFTKEEIFALIAPGLASSLDVNATEANAQAGRASFMDMAVWPVLTSLAEKITNDVLPVYGRSLAGEFDDVRPKNRQLELLEMEAAERVMTINEVRKTYYSLPPIPGGDRLQSEPARQPTPVTTPDIEAPETPDDTMDDLDDTETDDETTESTDL